MDEAGKSGSPQGAQTPEQHCPVFISYASHDVALGQKVCSALEAAGILCWIAPRDVVPGTQYADGIVHAIDDSSILVLVVSKEALGSAHVGRELERAASKRHPVVALRIDAAPLTPVFEYFLNQSQWIEVGTGGTDGAIAKLVEAVGRHLASGSTAPSTQAPQVSPVKPKATTSRRVWGIATIVVAVILIAGYFVVDKAWLHGRTAATAPITDKSIAVLPFVDMSEKKDQEYFSDGLSEELIDLLTKVPDLRVPARTSSFYFKGKSEDVATIAQKLRVAHVLEGSVRKAGNRLRVTAQLIRADNGYHLWSETYDRELKDVFQVQDEIAAAVVTALKLKLAPTQPFAPRYTSNVEAYGAFLLGTQFLRRGDVEGYRRAREALRKAIALDPNYAEAYSVLAYVEWETAGWVGDTAALAPAKAMADKAVALAPEQVYGYASRGFVRLQSWDWAGAQADYQKALAIDPTYGAAQLGYAALLGTLGRLPEAIVAARKSVELDPLSTEWWGALQNFLISNRDYVGAEESIHQALDVAPDSLDVLSNYGLLLLLEGKASEALVIYRKLNYEPLRLQGIALAEHTLGRANESQQALDELIAKYEQYSYWIALVYGWRGEKDKTFEKLELAYQRRISGLEDIKIAPLLNSLRADPRYKALLRKMNLPE